MSAKQRYKPGKSAFSTVEGARWNDCPGFIEPSQPSQHTKAPSGDAWIHEIKVDGYRCQLHVWHGALMAYTRRGYDWANRFQARFLSLFANVSFQMEPNLCSAVTFAPTGFDEGGTEHGKQ
jgi:ATP-dependent DNA ligase